MLRNGCLADIGHGIFGRGQAASVFSSLGTTRAWGGSVWSSATIESELPPADTSEFFAARCSTVEPTGLKPGSWSGNCWCPYIVKVTL